MAIFLNSYHPLCKYPKGREAIEIFNHKPFVDGSCRREPDFENKFPAITGLCRTDKLINRLNENDLIIYITVKMSYEGLLGWYFVGILQVLRLENNHIDAAEWYVNNGLPSSQNVCTPHSAPLHYKHSHYRAPYFDRYGNPDIRKWNLEYRQRSIDYPKVAICQVWNENLYLESPFLLSRETMTEIFNRIPGTQNPPTLDPFEWSNFQTIVLDNIQ